MSKLLRLYLSHKLTQRKSVDDPEKLNNSIRSANIDLNPHQVDAAIFAFKSPLSRGAILADEVGLGKTIEAGLIINQLWVEGRQHIMILVPASLRTQWQDELLNRFNLPSEILDGPALKKLQKDKSKTNPLTENGIYIASHNFAYRYDIYVKEVNWDLVVIDEAHRMRNVWRKGNKTAKKIKEAIKNYPKVLLTATPLQNNLMELYGLTSFLDENYLGTEFSFKTLFVNPIKKQKKFDNLIQLKERLMGKIIDGEISGGILTRTLRKQVRGLVKFTNRYSVTEDFAPNDNEMELYNLVSDYLQRPVLASTRATQRNMMELVYRKILASSSFAIAGTLEKIIHFLSKRLQNEQKATFDEVVYFIEQARISYEKKFNKKFASIIIKQAEESKDLVQEILPGIDDIEINLEKLQEENEDADDLSEDEFFDDKLKEKVEREIDHKFTKEEILTELQDVLYFYYLASTIDINQKSQALIRVLKKVFAHAEKKKWPQKAVIFTESRRTQDHLEKLLSANGYDLILFNGSNAGKKAKEIFDEWADKFPNEAQRGSKSISIRKALIWKFQQLTKSILITTEAGAEGLNLQFANIVINYDLPWNPQRVEQRIGRCHRYGQELDVLVINFLNKRNYADQRVYELLAEKIKLFGNLFDFTDKVLGTEIVTDDGYEVREVALAGLGAGLDFEKKILGIYRHCRTSKEIENGFKQLQLELSDIIEEKIEDTQKKVIQHFDEEVRQKLRIRQQNLDDSLCKFDRQIKMYLDAVFGNKIKYETDKIFQFDGNRYIFGGTTELMREQGLRPVNLGLDFVKQSLDKDKELSGKWQLKLQHPKESGRKYLDEYIGLDCQLVLDLITFQRKTINNTEEIFEQLVPSMIIQKDSNLIKVDMHRAEKIFDLDVVEEVNSPKRVHDSLIDYAVKNMEIAKQQIIENNERFVDQEMQVLDKFVEESLLKYEQDMQIIKNELKDLSKKLTNNSRTMGFHEKQEIYEEKDKKQKELFKLQNKYIQAEQQQLKEKDKKLMDLRGKLQITFASKRLAQINFKIIS
ncbi:DEAD/DEAH box helicase family protein [Patescibacteria group bacterium]|nr:DEAD/DEAH box helicase family protein [Patescibacteria group bacterium]